VTATQLATARPASDVRAQTGNDDGAPAVGPAWLNGGMSTPASAACRFSALRSIRCPAPSRRSLVPW
jgi:hypothetical protein